MVIKVYADGADLDAIRSLKGISGYTTNPTLCRKAGIGDYRAFGLQVLEEAAPLPVSLEVFSDDPVEMEREARAIASWGVNAVVKIPVMNSRGEFTGPVIEALSRDGVPINVTAVFTIPQVKQIVWSLRGPGALISIFAGRIADAGVDPEPIVAEAAKIAKPCGASVLWASTREVFNIVQAERCGAGVITMTPDLIAKLKKFGRDLTAYSLETCQQFKKDAEGFSI
jgi:transaldolase